MPNIASWAPLCILSSFLNGFLPVPQLQNLWGQITHFFKRMERLKRSHSWTGLMDRLIWHVFSVLNESTHASELRSGKGSCRHQFISLLSAVLMWNREYWQHLNNIPWENRWSKHRYKDLPFIISFLNTAVALKALYNVKLNPITSFSSITCGSHSEMSSNGK